MNWEKIDDMLGLEDDRARRRRQLTPERRQELLEELSEIRRSSLTVLTELRDKLVRTQVPIPARPELEQKPDLSEVVIRVGKDSFAVWSDTEKFEVCLRQGSFEETLLPVLNGRDLWEPLVRGANIRGLRGAPTRFDAVLQRSLTAWVEGMLNNERVGRGTRPR